MSGAYPQSVMHTFERQDMSQAPLHVTRWGDHGPRVVLVHGSAQGSSVGGDTHFSRQQALAEKGFQVFVPDRPGHGRSPAPGRPDDAEADAEWVVDLLEGGAHLVGHSFGGCVALAAAARKPKAVRSLTLIEPGMQKLATDDPAVRKFGIRILAAVLLSLTAAGRAERFSRIVGIPQDVRGGRNRDELTQIGRGIARLKLPSAVTLTRELATIKEAAIPLLVVTGGWNQAFDVVGKRVAQVGGGAHRLVSSPHHFANLVSDEFNEMFTVFAREAEAAMPG